MTTTVKQDLWEVASVLAMVRLGLLPLRKVDGKQLPPGKDLEALDPDRKARRKYRKIWRRELARDLREFDKMPKRRQKKERCWGEYVRGKWHDRGDDPLLYKLLTIEKAEVGERPTVWGRGYRWSLVMASPEFERELVKAARELGLMHRSRSM